MYSGSAMAFSFWCKEVSLFESLPAILIGGPPHTGKSVLTYSLSQALRKRAIDHYVIRACPDGEGDWSQEIGYEAARLLRVKGQWKHEFVQSICSALEQRQFPFLVDMGGRPTDWQVSILQRCTHSLLLLRPDDETTTRFWLQLVKDTGLLPLARIYSVLHGASAVASRFPVVEGTLSGLQRHSVAYGALFDLLVEHIHALFTTNLPQTVRQRHLANAPAEVVDLDASLQMFAPHSERWEPAMLQRLLPMLPLHQPLAFYGRGTNWLYGALVELPFPELFHQFDPRLGWVTPPQLVVGAATQVVSITLWEDSRVTVLSARLRDDYLDYAAAHQLTFPALSIEKGVILNGKLPHWLVTALVHFYNTVVGVSWVACYSPQLESAVVVASRVATYTPGDLVRLPAY
jgi:CRISPR-associated protein Csx3